MAIPEEGSAQCGWGLFPAGDYFVHGLDNSRWQGLASFPVTYTELLTRRRERTRKRAAF